MSNLIGQRLGQYQLTALLGKGGMATVYRAQQVSMGRDVAIKTIAPQLAQDPDALTRFQREARAIAKVSHPNILAIYDVGTVDSVNYVVTELLEGETLRTRLNRSPLLWRNAIEICIAVAEGLDAAHATSVSSPASTIGWLLVPALFLKR